MLSMGRNTEKVTVVVKHKNSKSYGTDFLEFSTEHKQFVIGNTAAFDGHGNVAVEMKVKDRDELQSAIYELESKGYEEIDTFSGLAI